MIRAPHRGRKDENGAILLTVLLTVAIMSTFAVALMDSMRFSIRRSANIEERNQAEMYAVGAVDFAGQLLAAHRRSNRSGMPVTEPIELPTDGGMIEGRLRDGSNCFNLNSLVTGKDSRDFEADSKALGLYRNLLQGLDFSEGRAESLASAAADWIDTDTRPLTGGAEDYEYAVQEPPYRTANGLMVHVSELRAVSGYDEEVYARVRPFVCAHPTTERSTININTLTPDQGALLVMLVGPKLSPFQASRIISDRPLGGFSSATDFWALEALAAIAPAEEIRNLAVLKTRYYNLKVQVTHHRAFVDMTSVLEVGANGRWSVVSQYYGAAE